MDFPELLQEGVKIVPIPPETEQKPLKIEQKPMEKEQKTWPDIGTKVCASCGKEKPYLDFQRNTKGERISVCTECMTARRKAGKGQKSPEQKLMEAVGVRLEKVAELCKELTAADLAAELRPRGYSGTLTRHEELNV